MRIKITGRNIELTDGIKDAVEDKLNKLEKYFTPDTDVYVTLSVEKERQKVEVTIPMKGNYIRSEQVSNDMYVSIDLVEEVIERQLKKYRTKLVTKQQSAASVFKQDFLDAASERAPADNRAHTFICKNRSGGGYPRGASQGEARRGSRENSANGQSFS